MQNIIQRWGYFTVIRFISIVFKKENENSVVRKCIVNQPMLLLGKNVEKSEL